MGTTETALPSVVCDAGPVIHLDELGFLDQVDFVTPVVAPEAQPSSACTGRGWSPAGVGGAHNRILTNALTPRTPGGHSVPRCC